MTKSICAERKLSAFESPRAPSALGWLLAAALLLGPAGAFASSRSEAGRHYRDGMALINAGQVDRGIEELKQAYAIKPHADVLYNIAGAYLGIGNLPEALRYFKLYLATDPEDRDYVESVVNRLTAALQQGQAPQQQPGPQAGRGGPTKPGGSAPAGKGAAGSADAQAILAQLQAMLEKAKQSEGAPALGGGSTEPAPALPKDDTMMEEVSITASARATGQKLAKELAGKHSDADSLFEEEVVAAGLHASSELKAPVSLTVISDEEIRMSGALTVPELLRRVPGLDVAEMNPSDTNVSIRGFNHRLANKVLVLVDGRSAYQDFLGATIWPLLDVSVNDISRIEVIRGPGSALYGASAFSGVVNIITKVGDEAAGARVFGAGGNHNTALGSASVGGRNGRLSYRTTIAYDRADKWTKDVADGRVDLVPQTSLTDRSREVQRADLSAVYDLGGGTKITAGGGYDNAPALELVPIGILRTFGVNGQSGFARLSIDHGDTHVKAFWNALRSNAGPEYWYTGLPSVNASVRSDLVDVQAQTGGSFRFLGQHHASIGVGYRYKTVAWPYINYNGSSRVEENHYNAFLQEDWDMSRTVALSLSYRVDRHPLLAAYSVTPGGLVHSARGSLTWEFKRNHVLRLSAGNAFRAPTFLESYVNTVTPTQVAPALGLLFNGSPLLRPEQMIQAELGYRGNLAYGRFQPDIALYAEQVTNLISDYNFTPQGQAGCTGTNAYLVGCAGFQNSPNKYVGGGAEVGFKYTPTDGLDLLANYAFEKIADCTNGCSLDTTAPNESSSNRGNTAAHKVNLGAQWRTRSGVDLGADAHFVSNVTWDEGAFSQQGVSYTAYPLGAYTLLNGRIGYRLLHDKLDLGFAVYNILGDNHREHPFGNQVGRRFLFTVSGTF